MTIKFFPSDKGPAGKLADAELHFSGGALDGLRLVGLSVWERRSGGGRNVVLPARVYTLNGERRNYVLLRPVHDQAAVERLKDLVLEAYREHEGALAEAV